MIIIFNLINSPFLSKPFTMKQTLSIDIREEKIPLAVAISQKIPEFINPAGSVIYEQRLLGKPHLILVAFVENEPAAFKVGYEKED